MTKEELAYIQTACREWLQQPGSATGSRIIIPANGVLSRPVEVELKGILTFDNMRILSAVDAETRVSYTTFIEQPDGSCEFFDTPLEKIASDSIPIRSSEPVAMRATQKQYHDAMQRLEETRRDANTDAQAIDSNSLWIEKGNSDSDERPKYQLYTNGKLLGYSLLERRGPAGQRSGRFHASENYFEYSNIFEQLPDAENECMETNVREAYGISDERALTTRTRFIELSAQVAALNVYLTNEAGTTIEVSEVRLEDLSAYYNDQSERWLHVVLEAKPNQD